jgi:dipeptidyl aminopeptidase/acylaminoacyl peptidase
VYTDHPTQFFLYDQTARSLAMIAPAYAALDGNIVAKKEKFDYVSSDGKNIRGYLTVPAGASEQSAPLIVLPHGGPESRSTQGFDYWSFFYAARGYLVYQPNFRGSDGYGYRFRSAGFGEWGRKMQDDISEGVKKLIADGVADPNRICIVGASYGGYAALAGATLTPDLYACAVSVNGVANLPGMLGQEARDSELSEDFWKIRIGDRFRDTASLTDVSPASQAANAKAPIMLIVSKDDIVVPPFQSIQMRDALKKAGKAHEYVELPGEDHWLSTGASRTEMLRRSIEFIDRHIGR